MTLPSNGTVTLIADGHVTYFPNTGFSGTDRFIYQVCDPIGACDTAEARITVSPADANNAPPTAVADNSITPLDTPVTITVLPNDFEPDGEPLTITPVTDAPTVEGGTFSVLSNNQLRYTPPRPGLSARIHSSTRCAIRRGAVILPWSSSKSSQRAPTPARCQSATAHPPQMGCRSQSMYLPMTRIPQVTP